MTLVMDVGTIEVRITTLLYIVEITQGVDITHPIPIMVGIDTSMFDTSTETGPMYEVVDIGKRFTSFREVLDTA